MVHLGANRSFCKIDEVVFYVNCLPNGLNFGVSVKVGKQPTLVAVLFETAHGWNMTNATSSS